MTLYLEGIVHSKLIFISIEALVTFCNPHKPSLSFKEGKNPEQWTHVASKDPDINKKQQMTQHNVTIRSYHKNMSPYCHTLVIFICNVHDLRLCIKQGVQHNGACD